MSGILLDVNRLAARNKLTFIVDHAGPAGARHRLPRSSRSPSIVQGRFGNISSFLGDLRTLVSVRGKRLDARGRLYSVSASTSRHPTARPSSRSSRPR